MQIHSQSTTLEPPYYGDGLTIFHHTLCSVIQHIHDELDRKVNSGDQSESRASGPREPSPKPNEKKCSHQPKKSKTQ